MELEERERRLQEKEMNNQPVFVFSISDRIATV